MDTVDVLIIEPSKDLSLVISQALTRKEISNSIANSAQAAISQADVATPRLIILEILMPKHNGLEFVYEFRSYEEWLNIPIIVYSQISKKELDAPSELIEEIGVKKHFYKPTTSLQQLVDCAEELLV